jgi:hypothetical protein
MYLTTAQHALIAGLMFALFPSVSLAAAPVIDPSMIGTLKALYEGFVAPLSAFGKSLGSGGLMLIGALLVLHIAVGGVQLAAGTTDLFDLVVKGIKLSIVGSLLYAAISPQAWLGTMAGLGGAVSLPEALVAGMYQLVTKAAAAAGPTSWFNNLGSAPIGVVGTSSLYGAVFDGIFQGLDSLLNVPWFASEQEFWSKLVSALDGSLILTMLFWIGAVFMYLLAAGVMLLELLGADLTLRVAIAFTPLMVPWLLFKPMEFLFNGWLKSMLIGGLGFVVGMLLLAGFSSFSNAATAQVLAQTHGNLDTGFSVATTFLPIFLGSFICFMLAPKANNIALGLLSGGGVDGISIMAFRHAAAAAAGASSAPKQGGREAVGRIANAGNAVSGAVGAAKAGVETGKSVAGSVQAGMAAGKSGGIAAGVTASRESFASRAVNTGVKNSPGGKAVAALATAQGKTLTPKEFRAAASNANQVYAKNRAEGAGASASAAAANKAASQSLMSTSTPGQRDNNSKAAAAQATAQAAAAPRNPFKGV